MKLKKESQIREPNLAQGAKCANLRKDNRGKVSLKFNIQQIFGQPLSRLAEFTTYQTSEEVG